MVVVVELVVQIAVVSEGRMSSLIWWMSEYSSATSSIKFDPNTTGITSRLINDVCANIFS